MARGKGGKKIKMVKMENKNHLQVTFSKRRSSLLNKANQLCTLCAAKVLLVVFSPTGKVYSFGNPSAERLIDQFLSGPKPGPTMRYMADAERNVQELNIKYAELMGQLQDENERAAQLKEKEKAMKSRGLWCGEVDGLDLNQLMHLKASLEQLKRNVALETRRISMGQAPSYPAAATPLVAFGETSSSSASTSTGGGVQWPQPYHRGFGNGDEGF